jgi:hypothetical protein
MAARVTSSQLTGDGDHDIIAVDPAAPLRSTGDRPAPAHPLGGRVLSFTPAGKGTMMTVATWNTGEPVDLQKWGNLSHAERQFIDFMRKKELRDLSPFFANIEAIEVEINLSPCTACADGLAGLLRDIIATRPAAPVTRAPNRVVDRPATATAPARTAILIGSPLARPPSVSATLRWEKLYAGGVQTTTWASLATLTKAGWRLTAPADARPSENSVHSGMVLVANL